MPSPPIGASLPATRWREEFRHAYADALDPAAVQRAVLAAAPDVIVHMLTAIPDPVDPRHLARDMALSNRLRTSGTANLPAADGARVIAQGIAHAYDPAGSPVKDEDAPLWRNPPRQFAPVVAAVRNMERRVTAAGGLVLRLGHLYGPGSSFDPTAAASPGSSAPAGSRWSATAPRCSPSSTPTT
jgi:nucleoside-diphosphate-sugar epimerase